MTSKPRTVLGSALAAAALLAAGCQSQVGTAADVGGTRISTDTLTATYKRVAATPGSTAGAALQRQVLNFLVTYRQATSVADKLHVSVNQGQINTDYTDLQAEVKASNQSAPDDEVRLVAQAQAVETVLSNYYLAHGGTADAADVHLFPVKDAATAKTVLGKVAADGSNLAALATTYGQGAVQKAQVSYTDVAQLKGLKTGQATSATVSGQSGDQTYVFYVDRPADVTDTQKALAAVKVTVNPRFGAWTADPDTGGFAVGAAPAGVLSKADPNKVADSSAPGASAGPSAAAPAPASAPSS